MKTELEILELVFELNGRTMDDGHTGPLVFESSGFSSCVTLYGEIVWDDEDYGAPWIDDDHQMPIRQYFEQRIAVIQQQIARNCEMMLDEPKEAK